MAEEKAIIKAAGKEVVKTEPSPLVKTGEMKTDLANIPEKPAPEAAVKVAKPKEADPTKEFVDGIMAEMALKGATKKRLIKMLIEQYGMDKQKVMFRLKRALITERYAALHAEAGH